MLKTTVVSFIKVTIFWYLVAAELSLTKWKVLFLINAPFSPRL